MRGVQEDSAHLAQEVSPRQAKLVLRQIPRKRRQRRGQDHRGRRRVSHYGEQPIVQATGVEVVRIATAPGLLRHVAARALARR